RIVYAPKSPGGGRRRFGRRFRGWIPECPVSEGVGFWVPSASFLSRGSKHVGGRCQAVAMIGLRDRTARSSESAEVGVRGRWRSRIRGRTCSRKNAPAFGVDRKRLTRSTGVRTGVRE